MGKRVKTNVDRRLQYCPRTCWRHGQSVYRSRGMDGGDRGPHVAQVPNLDRAVVGAGDDLLGATERGARHCFSVALCIDIVGI